MTANRISFLRVLLVLLVLVSGLSLGQVVEADKGTEPLRDQSIEKEELVILTTFSREPTQTIAESFKEAHPNIELRILHRRTRSIRQMLDKRYLDEVDLVLTSSPYLLQHLAEQRKLQQIDQRYPTPEWLAPYVLIKPNQALPFGYSGAGLIWNRDYLARHQLETPNGFESLTQFAYFGHITMSTPARSGTTQLMVESVLKTYGWQKGWQIISNLGANLGSIASRSFTVSDYVAKGRYGIGPTIDSYALLLQRDFPHLQFVHDANLTLMPTYIAVTRYGRADLAQKLMSLLRRPLVQNQLADSLLAKHSITDDALYSDNTPNLDLSQLMAREYLVNDIYDLMVTRRLPELQDAWLRLNTLKQHYRNDALVINKLDQLKQQLFKVPVTEHELANWQRRMARLDEQMTSENKPLILAEFSHELSQTLSANLSHVNRELHILMRGEER